MLEGFQNCGNLRSNHALLSAAQSPNIWQCIFLKKLLKNICNLSDESIDIYVDKQGADKLASNPVKHKRTNHIDIRYHIREVVKSEDVASKYCVSQEIIVYVLTKNLEKTKHNYFLEFNEFTLRRKVGI